MSTTVKVRRSRSTRSKAIVEATSLAFEDRSRNPPRERYVLRLYITGTTPRSCRAVANLRSLCEEHLAGQYDLEVIDIYQQPEEASQQQIIAAPTLVKQFPYPPKRVIGDLSNRDHVLHALDLSSKPSNPVHA